MGLVTGERRQTWLNTSAPPQLPMRQLPGLGVVEQRTMRFTFPEGAPFRLALGGAMPEFELAYDKPSACWRSEFQSPRVHLVWCLTVDGERLSGTGTLLPGKQTVRRIDARKDKS